LIKQRGNTSIRIASLGVKIPLDLLYDPTITLGGVRVWVILRDHPMTAKQLADEQKYSKATAARTINIMVRAGWIVGNKIPNGKKLGPPSYIYSAMTMKKNQQQTTKNKEF